MKLICAVLLCVLSSNTSYAVVSGPGPADDGTAIAEYNYTTGEISVSVTNIVNWSLQSSSASLSGPDNALPPLPQGGGVAGDSDLQIGESSFVQFSYTDVFLGEVALPNLPLGDLNIYWVPDLGGGEFSQPVVYVGLPVPEPSSLALGTLIAMGMVFRRRTYRR